MPLDEAGVEARARGIRHIATIHPDKNDPRKYAHLYIVRVKGPHGGHSILGPIKTRKGK